MKLVREISRNADVVYSVATNAFCIGMAGLASILITRVLGPQGRGQFAAVIVWTSLACALADLGVSQSCTYYSARRPQDAGTVLGTAMALSIAGGTVLLPILEVFVVRFLGSDMAASARLYMISVPVSMAVTCLSNTMLGLGKVWRFNLIKMVQAAGYLAGIAIAWLMGSTHVADVLTAILLFQGVSGCCALFCVTTVVPLTSWSTNRGMAKTLVDYGVRTYAGNLCWLANGRLDQALLASLAPIRELGVYAVAVSYAGIQSSVSGAVATVALSRAAQATSCEARRHELRHSLELIAILGIPMAALMACTAHYAIPIVYGTAFADACRPACILLLGGTFLGANYVSSSCLRADGRPAAPAVAEGVGVLVTIAALPFAIHRWGISGASWVSVASYAATATVLALLWTTRSQFHRTPERMEEIAVD